MENEKNYVFFDLETNGLDYITTGIMQISMIDKNGNVILNQYVYPFDNRIDGTAIHGIDEEKLILNNAISTPDLCVLIRKILREIYGRADIYLVAYNNFGYDQIILENNFKICNIKIPNNWYFSDMYPVVKELYPDIKPNFKLKTVFEKLCGVDNSINFHCSLGDTTCLFYIFKLIEKADKLHLFDKHTRGSLTDGMILKSGIVTLNGYSRAINLESKGVKNIGDFYELFKKHESNNEYFEMFLRNKMGIYSNFYINNLIKQINIINHFIS
jgi:DNA polymerase III epsilon subunit-like protein